MEGLVARERVREQHNLDHTEDHSTLKAAEESQGVGVPRRSLFRHCCLTCANHPCITLPVMQCKECHLI